MEILMDRELRAVEGAGFWGGMGCGIGLVGAFVAVVSPEPLGKLALLTYGGALVGCITAW